MTNSCVNNTGAFADKAAHIVLCIMGTNTFNNEVLSHFLASKTGMVCQCIQPSNLSTFFETVADKKAILFMDCASIGKLKACDTDPVKNIIQDKRLLVVCFNVDPDAGLEQAALKKKISGLIYTHQSIDMYPRATEAVLSGELWYPRKVLEACFLSIDSSSFSPSNGASVLTQREKEILKMLVSGIKNLDIAQKLCISPHTVKTHAYNIYKKINVTNRFQAAQWYSING